MKDWIEFKKSFTQEQEDALWQYFIDHSRIQPNGYWWIMFYVRDIDDFWRRVYARYTGAIKRYDVKDKEDKQNTVFSKGMIRKITYIRNHGTPYQKLVGWAYRYSRNYLEKMGNVDKFTKK